MVGHYDYFLVRYEENDDYEIENKNKHEVLDFLYERGFKYITGGGCPWVFIDIINKEFYVGKAGVKFGRVVGEHAITFKEFKFIYNIYEKYNGLGPIEMPKNNHRKEIERKELFEKYGLKTTKLKKQGAVVIVRGTSTIKTEPLTEEQKKIKNYEEKIERIIKISWEVVQSKGIADKVKWIYDQARTDSDCYDAIELPLKNTNSSAGELYTSMISMATIH